MAYHVEWYKEPHVVFIKLSGKLTQEDLAGFSAGLIELARHVPDSAVHTLVDVAEVTATPPVNIVVQEIRQMMDAFPNRDMSAMYGASTLVRFLAEMLSRFTSLRIRLMDSREEAIAFLMDVVEAQNDERVDA